MSKTFSVGDREYVKYIDDEGNDASYWHIKLAEDNSLPKGIEQNYLSINIFELYRFLDDYGLRKIYHDLNVPEPDYGLAKVQKYHVEEFTKALGWFKERNPECKPMFCWCIPESKCHCGATYKSADMIRLTWFAHWSRWVLENVKEPYFQIM